MVDTITKFISYGEYFFLFNISLLVYSISLQIHNKGWESGEVVDYKSFHILFPPESTGERCREKI